MLDRFRPFRLIAVAGAIIFALTVWPTIYRYDRLGISPVRINRITGKAWRLSSSGWELLTPPPTAALPSGRYARYFDISTTPEQAQGLSDKQLIDNFFSWVEDADPKYNSARSAFRELQKEFPNGANDKTSVDAIRKLDTNRYPWALNYGLAKTPPVGSGVTPNGGQPTATTLQPAKPPRSRNREP